MIQRDQDAPYFESHRSIDRISPTQSMLGSQFEGLGGQHRVQHSDGHVREPTQGCGERLHLRWSMARPADSPSDFDQHEIRHHDRKGLDTHHIKELTTDQMA